MTKQTAILYAIYVALVFAFPSCMPKKTHKRITDQQTGIAYAAGLRAGEEKEKKACEDALTNTFSTLTALNAPQSNPTASTPAGKKKSQKKAITASTTHIQDGCK